MMTLHLHIIVRMIVICQIYHMEKNSRQYENLRRDISSHLREFERNREWADFSNWLHRLLEALGNKKFPTLPQQINLCKRLAQCLNPSLPTGVHVTALKVYETILQNFSDKSELLALTALGLLPFFEHSNTQNKHTVLRIFEVYFISEVESIQMIVALVNALLTVLNEQSQELARKVYAICDKINCNYGKLWVDGAVWINILKSPKVRQAGFKYFTKAFKDRDRIMQGQVQKVAQQSEKEKKMIEQIEQSIRQSSLQEEEKYLQTAIYGYIKRPDQPNLRFPNFPTLVLNALSVCLDSTDNMIKRAALDLLGSHLKLTSGVFSKSQGIILVERMLLLLQGKEYSLTNRVYKYLFDQPNSEGAFHIDRQKKAYELQILREALANLLQPRTEKTQDNVLVIIEILIGDHEALTEFLLEALAHQIVTFAEQMQKQLKKEHTLTKNVSDFYLRVVFPRRRLFIAALLANIPKLNKDQIDPLAPCFNLTLEGLRFYFSRMEKIVVTSRKMSGGNLEQIEEKRIDQTKENIEYLSIRVQTLQNLIQYLYDFRPYEENEALTILDLCNEALVQIQLQCESKEEGISSVEVDRILALLGQEGELKRKKIYAKLLTLLPKPKKELLLPYIEDNVLSIVCINLILGGDRPVKDSTNRSRAGSAVKSLRSFSSRSGSITYAAYEPLALEQQQQKKVFSAIFKLLNCHLFQSKAIDFIQRFKTWWGDMFTQLIDKVEPSQWLIYWKRLEGDVAGGVVRMIQNLECLNSYHQHLSRKWLKDSESIVSKVLEPIYGLLEVRRKRKGSIEEEEIVLFKEWNIAEYQSIYNLLKSVFKFTSRNFVKYFYLQKDKYLASFILFVFKCLQNNSFAIKSKSLSMLTFILSQAELSDEKIVFVSMTLPNIQAILDVTITKKKELQGKLQQLRKIQAEKVDLPNPRSEAIREELVIWDNLEIELLQYVALCIKRMSETERTQFRAEEAVIECVKNSNLLDVVMKGIVFTQTYYIKRFYIQISKDLASLLSQVDKGKQEVSSLIRHVLDKLLILLKNSDFNNLEQIIRSRNDTGARDIAKKTQEEPVIDVYLSFSKENIPQQEIKENLNLEEKYAETIELWNTIKFYLQEAVKLDITEMPTISILSLVLKTFPLSYLKYAPVGSEDHVTNLEELGEEVGNQTGLRKEVFQIFQIIWNKDSREILDFLIEKSDPRILIHSQLDPSKVLQTFLRASKLKEVVKYLRADRFALPRNMLHYNLQNLLKQNQLMLFIYVYLLYCNLKLVRVPQKIKSFMESLIDFAELMKTSPHVQTKLWLLEVVELVAQRLLISKDSNVDVMFREKLQRLCKELLDQLKSIISKSKSFTKRHELKTGLFSLFNKQQKQVVYYDFVKVFPPTISQHFQKYQQASKKSQQMQTGKKAERKGFVEQPRERVSDYLLQEDKITLQKEKEVEQFLFSKFVNRTEQEFTEYLSLCALLTLIRIGNSVLIHLYERELGRVSLIVRDLLQNILPISDSRQEPNLLINQLIAQYLQTLLEHQHIRPDMLRNYRGKIVQIYMKDDFFKCTQPTLGHWRKIIDYCTETQNLLDQLLSRQGLLEGIFTRKAEGIRLKIKSFERVCFVIWSGKTDKYESKLRVVLQSLNEVMKQEQAPAALLILILFCIRVLLMRLSAATLNKIFRSVWPSLITLLIQIFRKDKAQKNPNLLLSALKVIQLIHALDLEDFILHRWIFLFDYFGIKLDPMGEIEDNLNHCEIHSPFVFKPFITNCLPNSRFRCKFLPEKVENELLGPKLHKRRLIVKKSFVNSEEEVKESGLLLMQYMMDLNECRTEIDRSEIDRVIQEDFITLDHYIFQIK